MTTTGLYNTQELRVHLNLSAINENSSPTFNIQWAGRTSQPVDVTNINTLSSQLISSINISYNVRIIAG